MSTKKQSKLYDLYEKKAKKARDNPDRELELAIELSKKEQIKEQKKLFELFERQSILDIDDDDWFQTVSHPPTPKKSLKRKLIKHEPEENESPLIVEDLSKLLKKENDSQEQQHLVIDDLSQFLKKEDQEEQQESLTIENLSHFLKKEEQEEEQESLVIDDLSQFLKREDQEEGLVIDDLSAFLDNDPEEITFRQPAQKGKRLQKETPKVTKKRAKKTTEPTSSSSKDIPKATKKRTRKTVEPKPSASMLPTPPILNYTQTERNIKCPICENWFEDEASAQEHIQFCSYSDQEQEQFEVEYPTEEDLIKDTNDSDCSIIDLCDPDGYLSPLEGFTNVLDMQGDNPYLAQFQPKVIKRKETASNSSGSGSRQKRPKTTKRKYNWRRKSRKKKA
ncbi:hypothetical protein G6F56_005117 [Rhizopus delemar]|nr:hypothetical protein G6F56_005117 [Rhizopus delemar]